MPQPLCGLWVALSFFTSPFFSPAPLCLRLSPSRFVRTQGVVVRGNCGRKRQRNKHHIPMRVMSNLPHYQHKPSFHLCVCVCPCVFLSLTRAHTHTHTHTHISSTTHLLYLTHQMHLRFGVHITSISINSTHYCLVYTNLTTT